MSSALDPPQIAALKVTLCRRREQLLDEVRQDLLKSDDDRAAMLADRVRDVGDESLADLIVDLDLADTDRDLGELTEVEAALERISLGAYGLCQHCARPIPFERLLAQPAARRCQPCQRMHELIFSAPPPASI